jgi:hypothetical protein
MDIIENDFFRISCSPEDDYIEVKLTGFLTPETGQKFAEAYIGAKAKLSADKSRHRTLFDLSELKIQTQDIVAQFGGMLADPSIRSARLALYVGDSAVRMQLKRIAHENTEIFDSLADAREWLKS